MQGTSHTEASLLDNVEENMDVFDDANNNIGTVKAVRIGDENPLNSTVETVTAEPEIRSRNGLIQDLVRAFGLETEIPQEIQKRMRRSGYIHVDTGMFSSDRIVLHEQIAHVTDNRVILNVDQDNVIKI